MAVVKQQTAPVLGDRGAVKLYPCVPPSYDSADDTSVHR